MAVPRTRTRKSKTAAQTNLTWPDNTEMVGLVLELSPTSDTYLDAQYAVRLHAWFLDRVRQTNPELSAYLHDGESEKPFT
ncbi:MAG TPA: CRISPR-associated endoribonuclease Cas6, partial [Cyanobacteria bacterium UBA11372]|nr:CRISPR-associated endoribonuclease Cas6 [Cyanobacteria bacterium UBA11372]